MTIHVFHGGQPPIELPPDVYNAVRDDFLAFGTAAWRTKADGTIEHVPLSEVPMTATEVLRRQSPEPK